MPQFVFEVAVNIQPWTLLLASLLEFAVLTQQLFYKYYCIDYLHMHLRVKYYRWHLADVIIVSLTTFC